jgi:hypothetical protein
MSDGENGPPWGPEKTMGEGVTTNDGGDCSGGLCAAAICVNNSVADTASKAIEAIWPVALIANLMFAQRLPINSGSAVLLVWSTG